MGIPATWSGFETVECYLCHTGFAMEKGLYDARHRDHRDFWCPNGHSQRFTGANPDEKRIKELESALMAERERTASATRQREWAESRAKGANIAAGIAKAAKNRLLHRVNCGVCPHCRRTFKQLAAHIKSKHAEAR